MEKYDNEVWRPVTGYPHYEVSNLGRVRSIRTRKDGKGKAVKVRFVLKLQKPKKCVKKSSQSDIKYSTYLVVRLWKNGHRTGKAVHSLVAQAFLGSRPVGYTIDHINENKHDNRSKNLQYITRRDNLVKTAGIKPVRNTRYFYTLYEDSLPSFSYSSYSVTDISRRVGVTPDVISQALRRKSKFVRNGFTITRKRL